MVVYELICWCGYQAEGWFADDEVYLRQNNAQQIACPICQSVRMRAKRQKQDSQKMTQSISEESLQALAKHLMQWLDVKTQDQSDVDIQKGGFTLTMGDSMEEVDDESFELGDNMGIDQTLNQMNQSSPRVALEITKPTSMLNEPPIDINWQAFSARPQKTWRRHRSMRPQPFPSTLHKEQESTLEQNVLEIASAVVSKALMALTAHKDGKRSNGEQDIPSMVHINPSEFMSREEIEVLREEGIESLTIALTDKRRWN